MASCDLPTLLPTSSKDDKHHNAPACDNSQFDQGTAADGTSVGANMNGDGKRKESMNDEIPSREELKEIGELILQDAKGTKHTFDSVVKADGAITRNLVILVRHFYCGNCQEYIKALSTQLPPSSLPSTTKITIIGCGSASLLSQYMKNTRCAFDTFTDPSQNLYKALKCGRTLNMGNETPEYMKSVNLLAVGARSAMQVLGSGLKAARGGDWWQIGGEFLFDVEGKQNNAVEKEKDAQSGLGWRCIRTHRMRNTRDHAEVSELRVWLGMEA